MRKITTKSGSVYLIDDDRKTWERYNEDPQHHGVRDKDGTTGAAAKGEFMELKGVELGRSMRIICPPMTKGTYCRLVATTSITEIKEL